MLDLAIVGKAMVGTSVALAGYHLLKPKTVTSSKRNELRNVFTVGGMYLEKKVPGKKQSNKKFPKVKSVTYTDENQKCTVVFEIPLGLDPEKVTSKKWLFQQVFGPGVTLDYVGRRFTLYIYPENLLDKYVYCYSDYVNVLRNLELPILVGKGFEGYLAYDMASNPHLAMAGENGSGKSTGLRSILTTLILTMDPTRLELYLADLKQSEFYIFEDIKHVRELDYNVDHLRGTLSSVVEKMKERGPLLKKFKVRHVKDLPEEHKVPYIIVAIDEVALLKKEKDIMGYLEEISTIGRALGVYLILSMQRPDADILDGKLKNNLVVRMAYRHPDQTNYQITLGESAPDHIGLSQKGRMWLRRDGFELVQSPNLEDDVAEELLRPFMKEEEQHESTDDQLPGLCDEPVEDSEEEEESSSL
jgi:DNA segregation ATPase FtsK/SpoIIIE, S-DNA-T family